MSDARKSGSFWARPAIHTGMKTPASHALTHPPAEVLDAVAQKDTRRLLRRLGVPADLASDVVQEVVTTAYVAIHHKGAELPVPEAHEPQWSKVRPFLAGIARRKAGELRRRARRRREVPVGLGADTRPLDAAAAPSPEQGAASAERRALVRRVLAGLPPEHAEILVLHAVEEMTTAEIAAARGLCENTVKSRLARARTHAREAVRNLPAEERRLLQGTALALLLGLGRRAEAHPPRPWPRGLGPGVVVLTAGIAITGPPGLVELPPVAPVIAVAAQPATALAPPSEESFAPIPSGAVDDDASEPIGPTTARTPPRSVNRVDSLAAENLLIRDARRAASGGAIGLALASIATHEQRYPTGRLSGVREALKAELRALVQRDR